MTTSKKDSYELIVSAQQFDCDSNYGKAFLKYLEGINALSNYLKSEAINKLQTIGTSSIDSELVSGVNTLKNCIERLEIITNYSLNNNNNSNQNQSNNQKVSKLTSTSIDGSVNGLNTTTGHNNNTHNGMRSTGVSPVSNSSSLEKAYNENAILTKIFRNRLRTTTDRSKKCSLELELERRLAENIQLAKAKDKLKNDEMRLAEAKALKEAAKKLEQQNLLDLDNQSMIVHIESQQQLYAQILQFEAKNSKIIKQFRCPDLTSDVSTFNQITSQILYNCEHPLAKWVRKFQYQIINIIDPLLKKYLKQRPIEEDQNQLADNSEQLSHSSLDLFDQMQITISESESEALGRHLNNITSEISNSDETITLMLTLIIFDEQLNYMPSDCDQLKDQHFLLHSIVGDYLYPPIWPSIQNLFRIVNYRQEEQLKKAMREVLFLEDLEKDLVNNFDKNVIEETAYALQSSIRLQSPYAKLRANVQLTQRLCTQFKSDSIDSSEMTADQLVPILCVVVLKSASPQLVSECCAIEHLVHEKYLLGEEGYCLSSIMTALKYIQINWTDVRNEQKDD